MSNVAELPNDEVEQTGDANVMALPDFLAAFGKDLMRAVAEQKKPVHDGTPVLLRDSVMDGLKRKPFAAQRNVVHAIAKLLVDSGERATVLNAEMGTGKTMMAISTAAVLQAEGYRRCLIISPPHLVYKWRREIMDTVPSARVWVLNGPDTIKKLLKIRAISEVVADDVPEFYVIGRVRMRMGFHWRHAYAVKREAYRLFADPDNPRSNCRLVTREWVACPRCGGVQTTIEGEPISVSEFISDKRQNCSTCKEPLWTLMLPRLRREKRNLVQDAICQIPTIGEKTAAKLISTFGEDLLGSMLEDNVHEFINLMDSGGELVFSDRQAKRMERALASLEFSFGQGGYQPTEFIKRYLPNQFFDLLVVDEGHEYKNDGSAQGQAMGVLAAKVSKVILLTGTLMGGYADDLFYLLWRIMPQRMLEDGYRPNRSGSLAAASMAFLREHGVLKDIFKESGKVVDEGSHRTARGKRVSVRTQKAPGFGPKGIARYVIPYTVFLKLKDIGGNVLPEYTEKLVEVPMDTMQSTQYVKMQLALKAELNTALRCGDKTLLGVVLNVLLAWPDCCFREEAVKHPRSRALLHYVGAVFGDNELMPKERELLNLCLLEKAEGRRVLAYSTYTGNRDTTARLKKVMSEAGLNVAVLRATVDPSRREDWIMDQVDRGCDVLICNPELVKTGLDLLDFPTIAFMQTGYNVYTLQQAARRSWRIGQKKDVRVFFFGYAETAQMTCLKLMSAKIAVSQSTSGDMPSNGLDVLNQEDDSIEVALAKKLLV
jgi:hypothetical protein